MRQRFIAFISLLALAFVCTSCNSTNLKKDYVINISSYAENREVNYSALINNELSAEKLITKSIDIHYVAENYLARDLSGLPFSFLDIYDGIGIECLRETDTGAMYSIHKIKQGGKLYIFYLNLPDSSPTDDKSAIRWFYVQEKLSSKDFEEIQEDSSMNDVKRVDAATQIYENIYNARANTYGERDGFFSYHYLSDGLLEFDYKTDNDILKVSQKRFIENFELRQYGFDREYPYDGHLLPIDQLQ